MVGENHADIGGSIITDKKSFRYVPLILLSRLGIVIRIVDRCRPSGIERPIRYDFRDATICIRYSGTDA